MCAEVTPLQKQRYSNRNQTFCVIYSPLLAHINVGIQTRGITSSRRRKTEGRKGDWGEINMKCPNICERGLRSRKLVVSCSCESCFYVLGFLDDFGVLTHWRETLRSLGHCNLLVNERSLRENKKNRTLEDPASKSIYPLQLAFLF